MISVNLIITASFAILSLANASSQSLCDWRRLLAPKDVESTESQNSDTLKFYHLNLGYIISRPEAKKVAEAFRTLSPSFNERCKALESQRPLTDSDYDDLLEIHFKDYLQKYSSTARLEAMRDEEMKESLARHGTKIPLPELSRINSSRILRLGAFDERFKSDAEIANVVENLELTAAHNGRTTKPIGDFVISSRQMKEYGFPGGMNSTSSFTSSFLRSDNQIFFALKISMRGRAHFSANQYGDRSHVLDRNLAKSHSWISPYLMYDYQFDEFTQSQFARLNLDGELNLSKSSMDERLNKMHFFDFTFEDFEHLVKTVAGNTLWKLKNGSAENQKEYKHFVSILHEGDSGRELERVIQTLVYSPLGLHAGISGQTWELKVPVAVPAEFLENRR